jgi:hypothetical protein
VAGAGTGPLVPRSPLPGDGTTTTFRCGLFGALAFILYRGEGTSRTHRMRPGSPLRPAETVLPLTDGAR